MFSQLGIAKTSALHAYTNTDGIHAYTNTDGIYAYTNTDGSGDDGRGMSLANF